MRPFGGQKQLPLLVASSTAQSWADVLRTYGVFCNYMKGVYVPTTHELQYGLGEMPSSWSAALFYYNVIKEYSGLSKPDGRLVALTLKKFKQSGNVAAIRRVFEEDVTADSLQSARFSIVLASYSGMWEKALDVMRSDYKIRSNPADRRAVIGTLCAARQWELALKVLRCAPRVEVSPPMIRPIIRELNLAKRHQDSLRLAAHSFANGYAITPGLFSALIKGLRDAGQWAVALQVADGLGLFTVSRTTAQKNATLYHHLVDCLYESNPYNTCSIDDIVKDITSRMSPRNVEFRVPSAQRRDFRLYTHNELWHRYRRILYPLSYVFCKMINLPRWYSRPLSGIVELSEENNNVVLVVDTNVVIQCVAKDLPLEHFYEHIKKQHPSVRQYHFATVVVPFTVLQEVYNLVWDPRTRLRHSVRLLLWSRVVGFMKHPSVYALSLPSEFTAMSLSIVSRMAYDKLGPMLAGDYHRDPDLRILSVCLSLQHFMRQRTLATVHHSAVPEGTLLFSFMKYHVRRYNNTVKGVAVDRLLLCTMDRRLARSASECGIASFPLKSA